MASTTIQIPNFDFSAFYYPQILEALIRYKRENVPELTDESEFEPSIQMLRAMALVGHLNSCTIDLVANESTLPTAQLVETVRNMLRLIGYELSSATPSQVELLYKLSRTFSSTIEIVSERARVATERSGSDAIITVEANAAVSVDRTDQLGAAFSLEDATYTDRTAKLVSIAPVDDFSPWVTPGVGDSLYFGHASILWDKLNIELSTGGSGLIGIWEFYDGDWLKVKPDSATPAGANITFVLNGLLGSAQRPGTTVRATLNETGAYEEAQVQWNGSQNFIVVGLLGQSSPSSDTEDYSVGSDWTEIDDVTDGTMNLQQTGEVSYTIPQSVTKNWVKTTVNNVEAYWIRYRLVVVSAPVSPVFRNTNLDRGNQYVIQLATQGFTTLDSPLGSSTGLADQRFETSRENFIKGSQSVEVDNIEWTEVDNFVNSQPTDRHYVIELGKNDKATVVFGSGAAGLIPPIGVNNISIEYRYGAQDDGNVGPDTLKVDKTGLTYVDSITNPRQASGWKEADGSSTESLERAKIEGPASIISGDVAIGTDDVETLTRSFADNLGSKPYARALAIEEGFGAKTIELVVVLQGGGLASAAQLEELAEYFNGDKYSTPPKRQRIVANQEVTVVNYTPRVIDVTAVVKTEATAQEIKNRLTQVLRPEALKNDGVNYEWEFGGKVTVSRINHEIFSVDENTTDVDITSPASDVQLGDRELPTVGTLSIIVVEP